MRIFLIVIRGIFRAILSASFSTIPIHTPPRECHTVYAANSRRRSASGVAVEDWIALPGTPGPPWRGRWVRRRRLRGRTPLVLIRNPVWRGLVRGICPGWMARGDAATLRARPNPKESGIAHSARSQAAARTVSTYRAAASARYTQAPHHSKCPSSTASSASFFTMPKR